MITYRHVFGPVRSGRLGLSLGLDCLGARICSFDCVYCEVGSTDRLTRARAPYVPAEAIVAELAAWKNEHGAALDHVTLGGQGEPCLNSDLAAIIKGAKDVFPGVPVAVLTNATPLTDAAARRELAGADVVLPSLDSLVDEEYRRVNRPHPAIDLQELSQAILDFRAEFSGRLWLEVLACAGLNDSSENLARLREYCRRLKPDRVDVVTLTRPGASPLAKPVSRDILAAWKRELDDAAAGTSASACPAASRPPEFEADSRPFSHNIDADLDERIINSLKRRPQTSIQLASALGAPLEEARAALARLAAAGRVDTSLVDDEAFHAYRGEGR